MQGVKPEQTLTTTFFISFQANVLRRTGKYIRPRPITAICTSERPTGLKYVEEIVRQLR